MLLSFLIAGILATLAIASPAIEKRACNQDKLGRCFSTSSKGASFYCSDYLGTKTSFTATVTPTITKFETFYSTKYITTTQKTTVVNTLNQTSTVTVTPGPASSRAARLMNRHAVTTPATTIPQLRAPLERRDTVTIPGCVATTTPPPDKITSACSCIGVTQKTIRTVSTAPSTFATVFETKTKTVTTTVLSATTTSTTARATRTISCDQQPIVAYNRYTYDPYYRGAGYETNNNNNGTRDPNYPPYSVEYPRSEYSVCTALQNCADYAGVEPIYQSFALTESSSKYVCKIFRGQLLTNEHWNVPNSAVLRGYGFSL